MDLLEEKGCETVGTKIDEHRYELDISSKDLRQKSGEVWEKVKEEDYIITSNGKPVAILTAADEDIEQQL